MQHTCAIRNPGTQQVSIHSNQCVPMCTPLLPADALPVCVVALRHYTHCPKLYQQLFNSTKHAAGATLNGHQATETCQAYLLLGVYHPPLCTFHEDCTFRYLRLVIR